MKLKQGHRYKLVTKTNQRILKRIESGVMCMVQGMSETVSILTYTGNWRFHANGTMLEAEFLNQENVLVWIPDSEFENLVAL